MLKVISMMQKKDDYTLGGIQEMGPGGTSLVR